MKTTRWAMFPALALVAGCASMFLHGGELVDKKYAGKIAITYKIEGPVAPGASYHLIKLEDGRDAIFERGADGSGTLIKNQWRENEEDHFFCWVGSGHGYEYVLPVDRKKNGRRYLYPKGYFSVKVENGVEKPDIGGVKVDPIGTMIPQ